jgi:ribosome recycling factor
MAYDFRAFDTRSKEIVDWLRGEFSGVRTGRATPALLDTIRVDSYGAKVPINQVASITIEDPRTLRIAPWDKDSIHTTERAILDANFGVSVSTDDAGLRVIFPELTSERRAQLLKVAKAKLEDARISLRAARDEIIKEMDAAKKAGTLSEDERFNAKEALQERVDKTNDEFNSMFNLKETEVNQ